LDRSIKKKVILLTGIADTTTLEEHLAEDFSVMQHVKYADHHHFTVKELAAVANIAQAHGADILTTEKDWVRIISDPLLLPKVEQMLFYQPMMVQFLEKENEFLSLLQAKVTTIVNS
jgi:tetraacyldisaccharide 4'-kinase